MEKSKKERRERKFDGNHSFNVDFATSEGIHKAVLANNYVFWFEKNYANNDAEHLERNWVFNSSSALAIQFPYMNERSIRRYIKEMVDDGYFFVGNFNKHKYDQTKRYSPTNKLLSILKMDLLGESDEYYFRLDNPVNNTNGQNDRSNGDNDRWNGPSDRPIHNIEDNIENNIELSNTNFPDGKIGNPNISDVLSNGDIINSLVKNNSNLPPTPSFSESGDRDYFNEKNSVALLSVMYDLGVVGIPKSEIKKNTRLMQALGGIRGDVDTIEEAISDIDFTGPDYLKQVADEIYRIHKNEIRNN